MGGAPSKGRLAKLVSQTNSNERFRRVDTDNSGSVSLAELQQVLSDDWNEDRIRKLIAVFDDDGSGELNAEEWKKACRLLNGLADGIWGHLLEKEEKASHSSKVDESKLPEGLKGFTPIGKQPKVLWFFGCAGCRSCMAPGCWS